MDQGPLEFYATPGRFTILEDGDFASSDVREVVAVVQGVLVYDVVAQPFYGVELSPIQAEAIHERDSARLLATAASRGFPSSPRGPARSQACWSSLPRLQSAQRGAAARWQVYRPGALRVRRVLPSWMVRGPLGRGSTGTPPMHDGRWLTHSSMPPGER